MALRASLVLSGDASSANAALDALDKNMAGAEAEAAKLAAAYAQVDRAISQLGRAQAAAATETARAKAEFSAGKISLEQYNAQLLETKTALGMVTSQHSSAVGALKQAQTALSGAAVSAGQARAGYQNLGRQAQDVAVQISGGANLGTIIAMQGSQVADAVAQMGGRFSKVAEFLSGPWGAAVIMAVAAAVNLAEGLWKASDAAEGNAEALAKIKVGSNGLSDIQTILGGVFDVTTGKMKDQTEAAIALAKASILLGQAQARQRLAEANSKITDATAQQWQFGGGMGGGVYLGRSRPIQGQIASQFRAGVISGSQAQDKLKQLRDMGRIDDATMADLAAAFANSENETNNLQQFDTAWSALQTGKLPSSLRKAGHKKKGPKGPSASELANFGEDTASKIAGIRDQFEDIPNQVRKTNDALRQLDGMLGDIGRKKGLDPAVAAALRKEIETTKAVINDSLNKPFNDYLEKNREAEQVDRLRLAGRQDEADALQIVIGLEKQQQPLSQGQLADVLATVRARREEAKVLRDQQAIIQAQVQGVSSLRSALEQSMAGLFKGKFSLDAVFAQIGSTYLEVASKRAVETLFGNALRQLEDKAAGLSPVDKAGKDMATAMDKGSTAVVDFAAAVARATAAVQGKSAPGASSFDRAFSGDWLGQAPANDNASSDIVVTANRPGKSMIDQLVGAMATTAELSEVMARSVTDPLASTLDHLLGVNFFRQLSGAFGGAYAGFLTAGPAGGVLGALNQVKGVPEAVDKAFGKTGVLADALKGAQTGTVVSGLAKAIGVELNSTGAQIGGAIGSFIPIPGASIVTSIVGGLLGNLFGSKPRGSGSVTQNGVSVTANNGAVKDGLTSFGNSIQTAVSKIAEALGGTVGAYDVGIGNYKGKYYQVSSSGSDGALGQAEYYKKSSMVLYDGTDATAALQAAIGGAIADGAVKGISAKVAAALKSSTDIDKVIAEAVKVQDLEVLLGGVTGALTKEFRSFEATAKERVRLAQQYGFDLLAVDKLNADERLKLQDKLLTQQAGSLKQLIEDMTSGSLFEGSSIDKRQALLDQIATVKVQADQGVEGAADKLANLLQDLNAVSKDAYGTTAGFAADRSTILDTARDAVAKANQRVADAQAAAAASNQDVATALNENNDQNAQMIAWLQQIASGQGVAANSNYAALAAAAGF